MAENKKDYNDITIEKEIVKKIGSINSVRTARIVASDRLKNLSNRWNTLLFFFNVFAIIFVITSLVLESNKSLIVLTSSYTLYVILLQYYISVKNYDERSLRFHYHQLELESNILELKLLVDIINNENLSADKRTKLVENYNFIMEKYQLNLRDIENHSPGDFKVGKNLTFIERWNIDNFFLIINIILLIGSFIIYLLTLFT